MAITRRTLKLNDELRLIISSLADDATRDLVKAWVRAWDELERQFRDAIADLVKLGDGEWPDLGQITRATRAQKALAAALTEIQALSDLTGVLVVHAGGEAVAQAAEWQSRLIASQLPPSAGKAALAAGTFDRISGEALAAIVQRVTMDVVALTRPLSVDADEAMRRALIRGVTVGENPRVTARAMLARVEGAFNGGLTRALTIARTEILDASRSGAGAAQITNDDVLAGWVWQAQLDSRTCPSCWSQHGSEHDLSETGPNDHQNGRCARVPKTKTWRQLGFAIPEPPSVMADAQSVFRRLPEKDQLAVMGPTRLAALRSGSIGWRELSVRRYTPGWRDSMVPLPVYQIRRRAFRVVG